MKKQSYTAPEMKVHGTIAELTHMPSKTVGESDGCTLVIPGLPDAGLKNLNGSCTCI